MDTTPPQSPDTARSLLQIYAGHKGRLSAKVTDEVVAAYLRASGSRDAYGNYLFSNGRMRWHYAKQNLQLQERDGGRWSNVRSEPFVRAALRMLEEAARVAGDTAATERVRRELSSRDGDRQRRADAAERDARQAEVSDVTAKAFARQHPDAFLRSQGFGRPLSEAEVVGFRADIARIRAEYEALVARGDALPGDGDLASADHPPVAPIVRDMAYSWRETVGGVPYTVRVQRVERGVADVEIGRSSGGISVSAATMSPSFRRYPAQGDAYLSGSFRVAADGERSASLLMLVSQSSLGGLRAASIWCRMMAGWGVRQWKALGLNDQASRFVKILAERGALEVVGRHGSSLTVQCGGRRSNPPSDADGPKLTATYDRAKEIGSVVARMGRKKVGYATWWMEQRTRGAPTAELHMVYVEPDARVGGLGLRLIDRVREEATAAGAEEIHTDVVWAGALRLVDRVFGADSRLSLDTDIREYSLEEALQRLPQTAPKLEKDGSLNAHGSMHVRYDLTGRTARARHADEAPAEALPSDVRDALEHVHQLYDLPTDVGRYDRRMVATMPLSDVGRYDDPSSWLEIEEGSLVGIRDEELREELARFRGREWSDTAMGWRRDGVWRIPPVVVVESKDAGGLGDGRGRFNLATGLGLDALPVEILTLREGRARPRR